MMNLSSCNLTFHWNDIMGLLDIEGLSLAVEDTVILNDLTLDLWEGYVHAIVGPNGAGKSTLASAIMGLEGYRNTQGAMRFDGQSLTELTVDERVRLGMTLGWQEPARFEGLPVRTFVKSASRNGLTDSGVDDILVKVGLEPQRYNHRAVDKTLSGGERKKAELASILAMKPRLVILDEPDSGIDVESLRRIRDAIDLLKQGGSTVLLITHSEEVLSWAEHAFLLCCGRVVEKGSVAKIGQYFGRKCIPCDHKNRPQLNGSLSE